MSAEMKIGKAEPQPRAAGSAAVFPAARHHWLTPLMLPSLAALFFTVGLLQMLFVTPGPQILFRDSDAGWHIRNGETILANRTVPRADPFSYTRGGREWFAWEWLSDAILGGAHAIAGPIGVTLLAATVIVSSTAAAVKLALALGGNFFLTVIAGLAVLGTTSLHWLARPHIFSWLLALAFIAVAEGARRAGTGIPARPDGQEWPSLLYLLPLLACLWANMHGSFLLGPGILLIYAIGEWINEVWSAECGVRNEEEQIVPQSALRTPHSALRFVAAALACLLATFINPYGWKLHGHIITYLRDNYLMDHVAEFRSFSFHLDGAGYVELFLLLAAAGVVALFYQRAYAPALLGLVLLHMSLYSARHLPTSAVVLMPLCTAALSREIAGWPRLRAFINYSERVRSIERRMWGTIPVVGVVLLSALGIAGLNSQGRVGFNPEIFPVRAAQFLELRGLANDPPGAERRLFATDQWGGYLIYRFKGRIKVFADGRSDFYGQDLLEPYAQVMEAKPGWDNVLAQYQVRFVLVRSDQVLSSVLAMNRDWKRVYADSLANIFEKVS